MLLAGDTRMPVDTRLIAVCGADGAGKSTLVAELERRQDLPDCAYLSPPATTGSNAALLGRYAGPVPGNDFFEAMSVARVYDYLEFYDNAVRPLIGTKRFVVCDGYMTCFIGQLKSMGSSFPIEASCAQVKQPDLTLYVQAPASLIDQRLSVRSDNSAHELTGIARRYHENYMQWLPHSSPAYCIIDNSGTAEETGARAGEELRRHFAG